MPDFPPPQGSQVLGTAGQAPTTAALVAYVLFGFAALTQIGGSGLAVPAPLLTLIGVVGVIVAYVKRSDARGTWLESHMTWLIRTFWWSTVWAVIGWVLFVTILGIPFALAIWAVVALWVLYRVIRGVLNLKDQRPIAV
jgi:uncharacterized membrane protein